MLSLLPFIIINLRYIIYIILMSLLQIIIQKLDYISFIFIMQSYKLLLSFWNGIL
jgi:hypothetical protein